MYHLWPHVCLGDPKMFSNHALLCRCIQYTFSQVGKLLENNIDYYDYLFDDEKDNQLNNTKEFIINQKVITLEQVCI